MERICQRLRRSRRAEFSGVNELAEHSQARAGSTNRRQLGIEKKIYPGLHRRAAPQVHVRRLITTGNPKGLSVLYMAADIRRICTCYGSNNDRFHRIHLRTELLDVRIVSVCTSGPDHNEVAAACTLAHPLKRSVNVRTS